MTFRFLLERVSIVGALTLGFPAEVGWGPATAAAAAARGLCCVSSGQDAAAAAYVGFVLGRSWRSLAAAAAADCQLVVAVSGLSLQLLSCRYDSSAISSAVLPFFCSASWCDFSHCWIISALDLQSFILEM